MSGRRSGKTKQTKKNKQEQAIKWRRQQRHKTQKPSPMTIDPETKKEDDENQKVKVGGRRFFGCYLLTSLCPRFKGHTYIGFTVNPKRRIRQHNGEITSGAFRTKKKRPWEMVLCIHGFPTNVAALQFEWAWQHPRESVAVREAAASFKTLGGLANKIKLALTMLTLHSWQSMNLTVSFFSTKYMAHAAGCPNLPHQMKLHFCSMDELPCYGNNDHFNSFDDEDNVNSSDGEVFANYSDERLESSTCDLIESDNVCCTIKSATDNVLVGEHIVFGGPLEFKSSSMAGTLEEHVEPLNQFPVDVSGSTMNASNKFSRPCEESWIEDDQSSFPVFEHHRQPTCGVQASENEFMPVSQEILPSCQSPADVPAPTQNDLNERLRLGEKIGIKELRDSFPLIEENVWSFEHAGPSQRQQSSMVDVVSVVEETVKKDNVTCIIIDDITEEQSLLTRVPSPIRFVNTVWPCTNKGIEVIELCTPSPEFRFATGSKKRSHR